MNETQRPAENGLPTEVKFHDIRAALAAVPVGTVIESRTRMVKCENGGWRHEVNHIVSSGYYVPAGSVTPPASTEVWCAEHGPECPYGCIR